MMQSSSCIVTSISVDNTLSIYCPYFCENNVKNVVKLDFYTSIYLTLIVTILLFFVTILSTGLGLSVRSEVILILSSTKTQDKSSLLVETKSLIGGD